MKRKLLEWKEVKGAAGIAFNRAYGEKYIFGYSKKGKKYLLIINDASITVSFTLKTERACKMIANILELK